MAAWISLAFPMEVPTWPFLSPTTTRILNEKRFPPLTTLATRFMATTVSASSIPSGLIRGTPSPYSDERRVTSDESLLPFPSSLISRLSFLEIETGFARGLRKSLDPTVIDMAAAVKKDLLHTRGDRLLREELAHGFGGRDISTVFQLSFKFGGK